MLSPSFVAANMTINIVGASLFALGLVLLVSTVMLWRGASVDQEVLAPLEVMADRKFARANDEHRVELLNLVRQEGSEHVYEFADAQVLIREPVSQPKRPWLDPFPHDDDAVDVVTLAPAVIDPLLQNNRKDI